MDLYREYLKEKNNIELLVHEFGFLSYSLLPEGAFLEDLFVIPKKRRQGVYKNLIAQFIKIARLKGYKRLIGRVGFECNQTANDTLKASLNFGWKVCKLTPEEVWIALDIGE